MKFIEKMDWRQAKMFEKCEKIIARKAPIILGTRIASVNAFDYEWFVLSNRIVFPRKEVEEKDLAAFIWWLLQEKQAVIWAGSSVEGWSGGSSCEIERTPEWWGKVYPLFPHFVGLEIVKVCGGNVVRYEPESEKRGGPYNPNKIRFYNEGFRLIAGGKTEKIHAEDVDETWTKFKDRFVSGTCQSNSGAALCVESVFAYRLQK